MSSKPFTEKEFNDLVAAFREQPGNISHAARTAGVNRQTARKAWGVGWRNKRFAETPIKVLFEQEKEAARAARRQQELELARLEAERAIQARQDAIDARKEEAIGSKASRKNALNLAVAASRMLDVANRCAEELQLRVKNGVAKMGTGELRKTIEAAGRLTHRAESVMRLALEIERIILGEPIATVGLRVDNMTPDQMVDEFMSIAREVARAEALGTASAGGSDDDGGTPPVTNGAGGALH